MKTYYVIKNTNGSYLKIRTGNNGAKRAWVKTLKAATVFAEGQAEAAVEELKNSPYYNGLSIEAIGEAESAWQVKSVSRYDIRFDSDTMSDRMGFESSKEDCMNLIETRQLPYFEDYKGGSVSIISTDTEEVVYTEEI